MVMTRGAFSHLVAPGFRKIVFETYKERPMEGNVITNQNTARRAYLEDFPIAGFGTLVSKAEGASVTYQDAIQGAVKRYIWTTYALGFRITQEIMEDDLYGVMGGRMSKALGRSARNNAEIVMHAPYNSAFDTTVNGFETGVALCSQSHVTLRGGTLSNRSATDADFDLLALQAALEAFHTLTDESGIPAVFIPRWLVHSIGDKWLVEQTLKSQYLPGTNFNDVNAVGKEGVDPHLSHYLTDTNSWYVVCDQHDVNYFERRSFMFTNSDDFNSGDALFKGTRRNGSGFGDWRGIYGSQGV